jgi:hypothetical protein
MTQVYKQIQKQVEDGISYLLERREEDPYKGFVQRVVYERMNASQAEAGGRKTAPTFVP